MKLHTRSMIKAMYTGNIHIDIRLLLQVTCHLALPFFKKAYLTLPLIQNTLASFNFFFFHTKTVFLNKEKEEDKKGRSKDLCEND